MSLLPLAHAFVADANVGEYSFEIAPLHPEDSVVLAGWPEFLAHVGILIPLLVVVRPRASPHAASAPRVSQLHHAKAFLCFGSRDLGRTYQRVAVAVHQAVTPPAFYHVCVRIGDESRHHEVVAIAFQHVFEQFSIVKVFLVWPIAVKFVQIAVFAV